MADQGVKEPSTVQEDLPPAKFWAQRGLEAYDHTIFEKSSIGQGTLKKNKSFLDASALFYQMRNGVSWTEKCQRDGLDPDSDAAKKKLGEYGIDSMRWFQNNIGSTAAVASVISKATNEQKIAALYMIQSYAHAKISAGGVLDAIWQNAIDPTNAVSIGIGLVSGGTGTAAAQAARLGAQRTLVASMKTAVTHAITKQYGRIASEAAIGAVGNMVQDSIQQNVKMNDIKVDGSTIRLQQAFSAGDVASAGGWGLGAGVGFGVAGHALGAAARWGTDKVGWTGPATTSNVTPNVAPSSNASSTSPTGFVYDDVIRKPYISLYQQVLRRNPFQWVNEVAAGFAHPDGASVAWRKLPLRDLLSHKFINPVINHVDDAVKNAKLIDPIKKMRHDLDDLRIKMSSAGSDQSKAVIDKQITIRLEKFSKDHRKEFRDLKTTLEVLKARLDDPRLEVGGQALSQAGLEKTHVLPLLKRVNHYIRLCDAVQDEKSFLDLYNKNRQAFNDVGKEAAGVTGAFQHYLGMAANAELRIKTRDLTGWAPSFNPIPKHWNPLRSDLGKALDYNASLLKKGLSPQEYDRRKIDLDTFTSKIDNGDDGLIAGGLWRRHRPIIENSFRDYRETKDGYYNDKIRTRTMINNIDPSSPDNAENYAIVVTRAFEKYKKSDGTIDNAGLMDELVGQAFKCYDVGREGDYLNALRRLNMQQGRDGSVYTVPQGFIDKLVFVAKNSHNMDKDAHIGDFVEAVKVVASTDHSPQLYGPRDMAKRLERATRLGYDAKLAPGGNILGVPGRIYLVNWPLTTTFNYGLTTITGGRVVPNVDGQGKLLPEKPPTRPHWDMWNPAPKEATGTQRIWHELTARNFALTWLATPVTLPLRMASSIKDNLTPVWNHTWRGFALVGAIGGAVAGVEEAIEWKTGKESYEIGKTLLKWELLYGLDPVFGYPLRGSVWLGEKAFNQALNTQMAVIGLPTGLYKPDPDKSIWDILVNPGFVGSTGIGSLAWNTPIPTGWLENNPDKPTAPSPQPEKTEPPKSSQTSPPAPVPSAPVKTIPESGGALASTGKEKPEDEKQKEIEKDLEKAKEKAREELRAFGRTVASLTNAIADDGQWTEDRQKTVAKLQAQRLTLEAQVKNINLGNYANDILKQATETLDSQLRNNMTHGTPTRVPTFQEEEGRRQLEYGDKVRAWHDRVRALNVDVQKGWNATYKAIPDKLKTEHDSFASDIAFLRQDLQETDKRGVEMLKTLAGAAKADNPALSHVRRTDTPPENPEAEQKRQDEKRKAEEAEKLKKEKEEAAKEKAEQDKARKELLTKQKREGAGKDDKKSDSNSNKPKGNETAKIPDGSEKGIGDHIADLGNAYGNYVELDSEKGTGSSLGTMFNSAVSGGWNWLGNAYTNFKNKPGGGGRTIMRDVGAGIGAVIASSALISPFWDKMWVGQIPIVGSILKLGSLVLTFMLFRKWLDTGMDPAPKLEPATRLVQSEQTAERSYVPRLENGQPVYSQSHKGGTPDKSTVIYWDTNDENAAQAIGIEMKAGKPVLQIRTDNGQIYVSKGIVSQDTVTQSAAQIKGSINVPYDRLNANGGMAKDLEFETVSHVGGDSFITKVGDKNHLFSLDQGKTFSELALEPR